MVASLKGIQLTLVRRYRQFCNDIGAPNYSAAYTFIEPSYNALADYKCSTSQHPLDDVTRGESLIKCIYEAIRNSPVWNDSLLIITWDEHGGFYDHAGAAARRRPRGYSAWTTTTQSIRLHVRTVRSARSGGGDFAADSAQRG